MEAVVDVKYRPALFSNGGVAAAAKKMRRGPASVAGADTGVYRECLKNHAASLGGHALDGCGEFMPSPETDPADPSSLRCAACGCHRNFHRRLPEAPPPPPLLALPPPPPLLQPAPAPPVAPHVVRESRPMRGEEAPEDRLPGAFEDETDESDEGSDFDEDGPLSPPPGYLHATPPHMLLALGTGAPGALTPAAAAAAPRPPASLGPTPTPAPGTVPAAAAAAAAVARKRFRTKFSPEQKQRMQALSERLGWRLQKRDEAVVDECCREIGVTKGVFKVWMHNNKHNFVGGHSARRSASASAAATANATGTAAATHPSSSHATAFHHGAPAPPAAAAPPRAAPVLHTDFNINGAAAAAAAADYFRVQPSSATASAGSPQSS